MNSNVFSKNKRGAVSLRQSEAAPFYGKQELISKKLVEIFRKKKQQSPPCYKNRNGGRKNIFSCGKLSRTKQVKGNAEKFAFLFIVELIDVVGKSKENGLRKNI